MRIIALDLSLSATGVAVYTPRIPGEPGTISTFTMKSPAKYGRGVSRLSYYDEELRKLLYVTRFVPPGLREPGEPEAQDWLPDVAVLEDYPYGVKGKGMRSLAELGGVVRLRLYRAGVPFVTINVSKLKILATGRGNKITKDDVLGSAMKRLGYEGHNGRYSNDEADALWLLQFALQHYRLPGSVDLPKTHLRALRGIEWPRK